MKIYYENGDFPLSEGKIFFRLDGTFDATGNQYVWTIGKGIYGIFENDELIYVGETAKSFQDRMRAHAKCVKEKSTVNKMYQYIIDNFEENKFYMRPLVEVANRVKLVGELQLRDIQAMELAFITCFRPKFNIVGIYKDYQLNDLLPMTVKKKVEGKTYIEYEEQLVKLEIAVKENDLQWLKKCKEYEEKVEKLQKLVDFHTGKI